MNGTITIASLSFEIELFDADSGIQVLFDKIVVAADDVDAAIAKARLYSSEAWPDTIVDVRGVRVLNQTIVV